MTRISMGIYIGFDYSGLMTIDMGFDVNPGII